MNPYGYLVPYGYMGYISSLGVWRLFETEEEYKEFLRELDEGDVYEEES